MSLTRINNNQITDAVSGNTQFGIDANTKVQPYSITSTLLANNLTYGSDLTVSGNLSVTGTTTAIDTTNTTIEDPLLLLASTQSGAPAVDIGYIGQRGTSNNIASVWNESSQAFVTVYTDSTSGNTTVNILSYADFITGNANVTGTLTAANISFTGNVTGNLNVTGNIAANNINITTDISATGNVYGANVVASFLYGDGSNISNLSISPSKIYNGNSYANIASSDGNLVIAVGASSNAVATFTEAGIYFDGNFNGGFGNGGITVNGNLAVQNGNIYMGKNGAANPDPSRIQFGFGSSISEANVAFGFGQLAGLLIEANGANSGNITIESANANGNIQFTNATFGNMWTINGYDGSLNSTQPGINISATGNVVANEVYGNHLYDSSLGNYQIVYAYGANIGQLQTSSSLAFTGGGAVLSVGVPMSVLGNVTATDNVTGGNVLTGGEFSATGNATVGNVLTGGLVSAGGNVIAFDSLNGANLSLSGNVVSNLNITNNVFANNVNTTNNVSATGNVYAANFATTGASGNITGANIIAAVTLTATGNIYGNNISATTEISAGGNIITNQSFVGNALTGNTLIITSTASGLLLSVTGNINTNNTYINNVPTPAQANDAANKQYVDDVAQGLNVHDSTYAATPNTLAVLSGGTVSYNNGNAGVGANLVTTGGTYTNIDGVAINTVGTRILVKDEANTAWNGVYTYSNATVLIRATDYDTVPEVESGDFMFNQFGNIYGNTSWVQTSTVTTIGSDPITFTQFGGAGTYTGGNGIAINGTVITTLYDGNTVGINGSNQLYIPANAPLVTPNIGDATGNSISVVGSVTGNVLTVTTASVIGDVLAGNVSATGNVTGGNVLTGGEVSATGNVYGANVVASFLYGDGSNISNLSISPSKIYNGNSYANIASSDGNLVIAVGNASNIVATYYDTGVNFAGNLSTTGNVLTGGEISATGNITAANFNTSGSNGNISGANVISTVTLTASGNVNGANVVASFLYGDGSNISNLSISPSKIYNGNSYANIASSDGNLVIAVGNTSNIVATYYDTGVNFAGNISASGNVLSSGEFSATGNVIAGNVLTGGEVSATANIIGGNVFTGGEFSATGNVTGDNLLGNTVSSAGNVVANGVYANALYGSSLNNYQIVYAYGNGVGQLQTSGSLAFTGGGAVLSVGVPMSVVGNITANTTMLVDTTTSSVTLGANITQTAGATLAINATDSMLIPVGNTVQRPATPATGMLRYNSTISQSEIWDGAAWVAVGGSAFTVIQNEQFTGDGTTVAFTLGSSQTTDSCIVTINGVVQIPTTAYSVSGVDPTCVLTFTEAPQVSDAIDVREITTTTSVTAISNSPGNAIVAVSSTIAQVNVTGNLVVDVNASAPSLAGNSTMSFRLINNTTLAIVVRGTDGTTRSGNITLS